MIRVSVDPDSDDLAYLAEVEVIDSPFSTLSPDYIGADACASVSSPCASNPETPAPAPAVWPPSPPPTPPADQPPAQDENSATTKPTQTKKTRATTRAAKPTEKTRVTLRAAPTKGKHTATLRPATGKKQRKNRAETAGRKYPKTESQKAEHKETTP